MLLPPPVNTFTHSTVNGYGMRFCDHDSHVLVGWMLGGVAQHVLGACCLATDA